MKNKKWFDILEINYDNFRKVVDVGKYEVYDDNTKLVKRDDIHNAIELIGGNTILIPHNARIIITEKADLIIELLLPEDTNES